MLGVLLASGALYLLSDVFSVSPDRIVGVFAWVTFAVTLYMLTLIPRLFDPLCAVDGDSHVLSHSHRRPGECSFSRSGVAG